MPPLSHRPIQQIQQKQTESIKGERSSFSCLGFHEHMTQTHLDQSHITPRLMWQPPCANLCWLILRVCSSEEDNIEQYRRDQLLSSCNHCLEYSDFFYFAASEFAVNKNLQTKYKIKVPSLFMSSILGWS